MAHLLHYHRMLTLWKDEGTRLEDRVRPRREQRKLAMTVREEERMRGSPVVLKLLGFVSWPL